MQIPKEAFTAATLLTIGGSATAVWLFTSVLTYLFGARADPAKKWVALLLSLGLALLAVAVGTDGALVTWVGGFFNGLIIFLTAVGESTVVAGSSGKSGKGLGAPGFNSPWF
jgi:hypothetical protein